MKLDSTCLILAAIFALCAIAAPFALSSPAPCGADTAIAGCAR